MDNEIVIADPSPASHNGLDPVTGKFMPGNKLGKGNPFNKEMNVLRGTLLRTMASRPKDYAEIIDSLIATAKRKDSTGLQAKKLILEYTEGKPTEHVISEQTISIVNALVADDSKEREERISRLIESRRVNVS